MTGCAERSKKSGDAPQARSIESAGSFFSGMTVVFGLSKCHTACRDSCRSFPIRVEVLRPVAPGVPILAHDFHRVLGAAGAVAAQQGIRWAIFVAAPADTFGVFRVQGKFLLFLEHGVESLASWNQASRRSSGRRDTLPATPASIPVSHPVLAVSMSVLPGF